MEIHDLDGFSEQCGILLETIESFMAGEKDLMVLDLIAIVRTFDVTVDFIMGIVHIRFLHLE